MFIERISALATLLSDLSISLHRPLEGAHNDRYGTMLGFFATASPYLPNPLTSDVNISSRFIMFVTSVIGHAFGSSTRIIIPRMPGITVRDVALVTNLLDRYAIDARIFENYSSRSVRNDYHLAVPGVVRLIGAHHATRSLICNTRVEAGGVVPGAALYKTGLEEYMILAAQQREIHIPGYIISTHVHFDALREIAGINEGALHMIPLPNRPNVTVGDIQLLEGRFISATGATVIRAQAAQPGLFGLVLTFRNTVSRIGQDAPSLTVTDDEVVSKWNHFLMSASPVMNAIKAIMFANNVPDQFFYHLSDEYKYVFVDMLYRVTELAEILAV